MTHRSVTVTRHSDAPVEVVWDLVAHASAWPTWTPIRKAELEREGSPEPDGVGAIRRFGSGLKVGVAREAVVAFEPPRHLGYTMLSGIPVLGYRSDVTLEPAPGGGTAITWAATFETPKPTTGWFWYRFLRFMLRSLASRLAEAAARSGAAAGG